MNVKLPTTLGACADRLYALKDEKAQLNRALEKLTQEESAIKEHLILTLPKSNAEGISGKRGHAQVVLKSIPQVKDWALFYKHILKTKSFELLQRRLSEGAIRERWDEKKRVPGVDVFKAVTVSVTKR